MALMLTRFRRNGGFQQLLALLESCDPARQEQLIKLISMEDPGWAQLAKRKILTLPRVLHWPDHVLSDVLPQIPYPIIVNLYLAVPQEFRGKVEGCLPPEWRRKFQADVEGARPNDTELFAATITLLQTVRALATQGLLRFVEFDPELNVDPRLVA